MGKLFLALLSILSLPVSANEPSLSGPFSPSVFSVDHDIALHRLARAHLNVNVHRDQHALIESNDDSAVMRGFHNAGLIQQDVPAISSASKVDGSTGRAYQSGFLNGGLTYTDSLSFTDNVWDRVSSEKRGWGMAWDLGVLYEGEPVVNLNVSCSAGLTAGQCASLATDVESEAMELRSDIVDHKWYPVLSLGFLYRF
jgi:hypothetical protein